MKKWIATSVFLVVSIVAGLAQGQVKADKIESGILGVTKDFMVYLPAGYEDSDKDFPVLYLLHGAGDTHTGWLEKGNAKNIADRVIREGMALPMIIIMPDASSVGGGSGRNMGYFNRSDWNYEDHFFDEFIPYVENKYRIKKEKKIPCRCRFVYGRRRVYGLCLASSGYI